MAGPLPLSYVLPLRWLDDRDAEDLTVYLRWLSQRVEVIVVDGSRPDLFASHLERWSRVSRLVAPDPDLSFANGKVNGVMTGIRRATHEAIVIADDDVRYDEEALAGLEAALAHADLVRPQNYFDPCPWHGAWDTARTLLNRAVSHDHPGTLGVRRDTVLRIGGYDGDCLFENLELTRTVEAAGGVVIDAPGLYVARRPPTLRHFLSQRVRQAYDDLAQPARLVLFLSILPTAVGLLARRTRMPLLVAAAGVIGLAERGRRRAGAATRFPRRATLFAPVWVAERAVCCWIAVGLWIFKGGVPYAGSRLRLAAHSRRALRARLETRRDDEPSGAPSRLGQALRNSPRAACM